MDGERRVIRPKPAGIATKYGTPEVRNGLAVRITKAAAPRTERRLTDSRRISTNPYPTPIRQEGAT